MSSINKFPGPIEESLPDEYNHFCLEIASFPCSRSSPSSSRLKIDQVVPGSVFFLEHTVDSVRPIFEKIQFKEDQSRELWWAGYVWV